MLRSRPTRTPGAGRTDTDRTVTQGRASSLTSLATLGSKGREEQGEGKRAAPRLRRGGPSLSTASLTSAGVLGLNLHPKVRLTCGHAAVALTLTREALAPCPHGGGLRLPSPVLESL